MRSDAVRRIALSLPEAEERETWGEATFRVRDKIFVILGSGGRASVKASVQEQSALVGTDQETFQIAPYVGRFGWVSVALGSVDRDEMRELVTEAWRLTAPKRLVAAFDEGP
jgi:hypothetical protein